MASDDLTKLLREEYTIDTPENVTFGYEVAGIGARFIAALIDTLLLGVGLLLLNILLVVLLNLVGSNAVVRFDLEAQGPSWIEGLVIALYALLNFAVFWGYYILFELFWNGQTPGKRV
ncbi:MAG TPA: RDD family protein, partial [Caldilineaceae bacterium]|nr:RDD family protein [Caldilineaceae bacterium]